VKVSNIYLLIILLRSGHGDTVGIKGKT